MINDLCKKNLEKKGYTVLTPEMRETYRQTMEAKFELDDLVTELIPEYNSLVQAYAELMTGIVKPSTKPLLADLKEADVKTRGIKGEELVKLYTDTFNISTEEEDESESEDANTER